VRSCPACISASPRLLADPHPDSPPRHQGFDGYLKPPTTGGAHKKKYEATEADRLFSSSSLTYQRVSSPQPTRSHGEDEAADDVSRLWTLVPKAGARGSPGCWPLGAFSSSFDDSHDPTRPLDFLTDPERLRPLRSHALPCHARLTARVFELASLEGRLPLTALSAMCLLGRMSDVGAPPYMYAWPAAMARSACRRRPSPRWRKQARDGQTQRSALRRAADHHSDRLTPAMSSTFYSLVRGAAVLAPVLAFCAVCADAAASTAEHAPPVGHA